MINILANSQFISWLIEQQVFISLILLSLLFLEKKSLPALGAKLSYALWLILPLGLVLTNLPYDVILIENNQVSRYLVGLNQANLAISQQNYIPALWLTGAIVILITGFFSRQQSLIESSLFPMSAERLPLDLPGGLRVYLSRQVSSPLLLGVSDPKLVLPDNYQALYSPEQLKMILEHEIYHLKRKDNLCNSLAIILLSLFWFNPLTWIGYFSFRRIQEISCDAAVLDNKSKSQCIEYGRALLICAEQTRTQLCAYTHYGEKSTMIQRLNNLKQRKTTKPLVQLAAITLTASLLAGVAMAKQPEVVNKTAEVHPIMRVEPVYPKAAAGQALEGSVVLQFDISAMGDVENVKVISAEPKGHFDRSAKTALNQWRYESSDSGVKNQLVQLDFVLNEDSNVRDLIERIKVSQ